VVGWPEPPEVTEPSLGSGQAEPILSRLLGLSLERAQGQL